MFVLLCNQVVLSSFFSSRRRHTILSVDWSSDVCSSDLRLRVVSVDAFPAERLLQMLSEGLLNQPILAVDVRDHTLSPALVVSRFGPSAPFRTAEMRKSRTSSALSRTPEKTVLKLWLST